MAKKPLDSDIVNRISYEELSRRYFQLVAALGADLDKATHEDALHVATVLNRVKTSIIHDRAEETGAYFICGEAGQKDQDGLPNRIMICPTMGVNGFAVYRKEVDWKNADGS